MWAFFFIFRGKIYDIFASQQHFKVLTKTKKDKVRILTNYATLELGVENLKFNVSDIYDLLKYIQQRYPSLLVEVNENFAEFSEGDKIYFTGNQVLESLNANVIIDPDTNLLKNTLNPDEKLKYQRFEFLFDYILMKVHGVNPEDNLTKSRKSIPYISVFMSGVKIPFIIYVWSQMGLMSALNRFSIDYIITEDRGETGDVIVELADKKFLVLRPNSVRERLIVNGLLTNKIKYPISDLDSPEEVAQHIADTYGVRTNFLINNITRNLIDPVSKEMCQFENYPTNLPGLLMGPALNMLLNQKPDSVTDLKIYRSRMSEIVLRILYKQLTRAANSYGHKVEFGDKDARLMIVDNYVINEFLGRNPPDQSVEKSAGSVLELTESVNPMDELILASKVIKTGPGGLQSKDEFTPAHRNIHPSHYGNMSAVSTPESATVGINTNHTLCPLIVNKYGS